MTRKGTELVNQKDAIKKEPTATTTTTKLLEIKYRTDKFSSRCGR